MSVLEEYWIQHSLEKQELQLIFESIQFQRIDFQTMNFLGKVYLPLVKYLKESGINNLMERFPLIAMVAFPVAPEIL